MKEREAIPHIGLIPIVIRLKLFLDLLRDPVFPRGLTDCQSYVPILTSHCVGIRSAVNTGKNGDICLIGYQLSLTGIRRISQEI